MVLLILSRIPTGLKIKAWVGYRAYITDIVLDMQITPSPPRPHPEKGKVQHGLRNGFIRERVTKGKGRVGKETQQPVQ